MHYWEIIAKAGWTYGYNKYVTGTGDSGVVYVAGAHRANGHEFIFQAETLMGAFIELQKILRG